jgi:ABC-type uncharacterized transport system YnjBCD ATPase subunit
MRSPDQLRAEVHWLHLTLRNTVDAEQRRHLAARALELAQQAEAIESLPDDVEGLQVRIAQYRYMLDRAESEPKQRVVAELLRDAESKSRQISSDKRLPRVHRLAVA